MRARFPFLCLVAGCTLIAARAAHAPVSPDPVWLSTGARPDARMARCVGDGDAWEMRDELEPHVASAPTDPDHVVAAWTVRAPGGPGGIQASVSHDGGRSWSAPTTVPFAACAGGPPGARFVGDPWVSIDGDGRAYVSAIGFMPTDDGPDSSSDLMVAVSGDGGAGWGSPLVVSELARDGATHDNTAVAAAPGAPGNAYLATTRYADHVAPAGTARTADGGKSWTALRPAPTPAPDAPVALAPQPLVGSDPMRVWMVFSHDPRGSRIALMESDDGGEHWSPSRPVAAWERPRGWPVYDDTSYRLEVGPDIVSAAIDRSVDSLWLAYMAPAEDAASAIRVVGSTDGGHTWRETLVSPNGEVGWRPTLAVARPGRLAVTWFRPDSAGSPAPALRCGDADPSPALPVAVDLAWLSTGPDGSAQTTGRRTLDRFTWRPRSNGRLFLGDYHGLAATEDGVVAVFGRTRECRVRVGAVRSTLPSTRAIGR